jgi:Domain of unknown function (DUF4276)
VKLGLILECCPSGPDEKVFRHWIETHLPDVELVRVDTLVSKQRLLSECGIAARGLIDACDQVVIVWDLWPTWEKKVGGKKPPPCLHNDREKAFASLKAAGVPIEKVALVAIESMLECWFLADEKALAAFLSEKLRKEINGQQIGRLNSPPEKQRRPKDILSSKFEEQGGSRYLDYNDAEEIARKINLTRLRRTRCPTFERFWQKVAGDETSPR